MLNETRFKAKYKSSKLQTYSLAKYLLSTFPHVRYHHLQGLFSGKRVMLSEFKRTTSVHTKANGIKYILETNMTLSTSSTFFLSINFSGRYEYGCGSTFNIMDTNKESIFHLDFRIFNKQRYRKIIMNSKLNGVWNSEIETNLSDLSKKSDIFIVVTANVFEISINNVVVNPQFPTNMTRFDAFTGFKVWQYGTCFIIDLEESYMDNGGRSYSFFWEIGIIAVAYIRHTAIIRPIYGHYMAFIKAFKGLYSAIIRPFYSPYAVTKRSLYGHYTAFV